MERNSYLNQIQKCFQVTPICALLGPRQCGKTTLARLYASHQENIHIFDLENERDLARLENPHLTLEHLDGTIIIDEIQRRPDLFPALRVLVDQSKQKFLILGSASRDLIKQSSETLAGRISYMEMTPFSVPETKNAQKNWLRGGFPRSYLATTEKQSVLWRKTYIRTFLERDVYNLGFDIHPQAMRRFWTMLAHYHGQIFNASEIGKSLSINHKTSSHYLDILSGTFIMRRLSPWFENISKRQVKSPKVYFRDSGLFHTLSGINTLSDLYTHPKLGAS